MRKVVLLFFLLASSYLLTAQNEIDALRYSFTTHGGTARYMGMSGAFGALGADFSSISTNPAGIGTFKKSRFMFSPVFSMNSIDASYKGENTGNDNVFVNMNNFGLILNLKSYDDEQTSGWKSVAFGIGYNKLRNLNSDITIRGFNTESSMLDQLMLNSDKKLPDDLIEIYNNEVEYHAYNSYLTDVDLSDTLYYHPYLFNYAVNQVKRTKAKGGIGEYVFSLGGNYNDVFQIGASFGIQNVRYKFESEYSEQSDSTILDNWVFNENLETRGVGYNFKIGMIYRPYEFFRIGLAFHTPTFYNLKDIYSYSVESNWRESPDPSRTDLNYSSDTEEYYNNQGQDYTENEYTYELYTPMRVVASVALVLARYSIISADYEYVDYGRARFRADDYDFKFENDNIKAAYNAGHNFRLGAEVRLAPIYIRGGLSYYGSPISKKINADGSIKGYSFGIGLKSENVYIDVAYNHSFYANTYQLYDYGDGIETSRINVNEEVINFTIGFKF